MASEGRDPNLGGAPAEAPCGSPGRLARVVTGVLFAAVVPVYLVAVTRHADRHNSDQKAISAIDGRAVPMVFHHDQHVYLNNGRMLRRSGYTYVVPRHRTPGYPALLSLFYGEKDAYPVTEGDPRRVSDAYFERAKVFNRWLAVAYILALFLFTRRALSPWSALMFAWAVGWFVYYPLAAYVQPEVLFMTLSFVAFVLLARQTIAPTWARGLFLGVLLGATYLVKAAILPMVPLFCFCFALKYLAQAWRDWRGGRFDWRPWLMAVGRGVVVPAVFFALLSPYFYRTWRMHGSPVWSVHSAHFMWMEDREDKRRWRHLLSLLEDGGEAPADAPSRERYFRHHTWRDFIVRSLDGTEISLRMIDRENRAGYRFVERRLGRTSAFVLVLCALAALAPALRRRGIVVEGGGERLPLADLRRHWYLVPYLALYLAGYSLLYGAYATFGAGTRLFLSMAPCVIYGLWLILERYPPDLAFPPGGGRKIPGRVLFRIVMALCLIGSLAVLAKNPPTGAAGDASEERDEAGGGTEK